MLQSYKILIQTNVVCNLNQSYFYFVVTIFLINYTHIIYYILIQLYYVYYILYVFCTKKFLQQFKIDIFTINNKKYFLNLETYNI